MKTNKKIAKKRVVKKYDWKPLAKAARFIFQQIPSSNFDVKAQFVASMASVLAVASPEDISMSNEFAEYFIVSK